MNYTFTKPFPTRFFPSSGGVKALTVGSVDNYLGVNARQKRKAAFISNLDSTNYLYVQTSNGTPLVLVPPLSPMVFETESDLQVLNLSTNSGTVNYIFSELFYDEGTASSSGSGGAGGSTQGSSSRASGGFTPGGRGGGSLAK